MRTKTGIATPPSRPIERPRRKWIDFHENPVDQLTELLSFFGVATWDSWQDLWTKDAAYRTSPVFEINPSAMGAGLYFVGAGEWVEL